MHGDMHAVLETLVVAIFLGIFAQLLAHRFKLPAILPLLICGMVAGPFGLHLFAPQSLGATLEALIHLGVAIILFEGGLSLDLRRLRTVGTEVGYLLSVGVLITWVGAGWLAYTLTDAPLATAALFGAIVTVTGPTVIAPLLRHMIAPRKVRTILLSEGLMIDPIGAVLAYFVLQWIELSGLEVRALMIELVRVFGLGAIFGYVAGSAAGFVARHRHTADELRNLAILALLLGSYLIAELSAPQSGIVAAVAMGLTMSATTIPDLVKVKIFKGQLTVLVISVLFILLSGQLDLAVMRDLGWGGLLVTVGLVLLVRPLAVFLSMPGGKLSWKEKSVLGLTAPRGIVAAAVASLSAIQLREKGFGGDSAAILEGLVYLTILVTCTWATIMAIVLPRLLGYVDDPSRRQVVLVGASRFTTALAQLFRQHDWMVVVIDSVRDKLRHLRATDVGSVVGDARDAATYEEACVERDSYLIAATPNDELNLLVAEMVREEFGVEHPVVVLQKVSEEFGQVRHAGIDVLGRQGLSLAEIERALASSGKELFDLYLHDDATRAEARSALRDEEIGLTLICGWQDGSGKPVFRVDADHLAGLSQISVLGDLPTARQHLSEAALAAARPEPDDEPVGDSQLTPATSG